MKALPLVQVFYFRQVPLIGEQKMVEIMEVLCKCLDDEVVEVREMAATTLSGILRLSPRRSVMTLKVSQPPSFPTPSPTRLLRLHAAFICTDLTHTPLSGPFRPPSKEQSHPSPFRSRIQRRHSTPTCGNPGHLRAGGQLSVYGGEVDAGLVGEYSGGAYV